MGFCGWSPACGEGDRGRRGGAGAGGLSGGLVDGGAFRTCMVGFSVMVWCGRFLGAVFVCDPAVHFKM